MCMKRAINLRRMKHTNKRMIFGSVLECPCSRAELADKLHLSRAAITTLTEEMIQEGLIYETSIHGGGVGRHPVLLDVHREEFYIGGLIIRRRDLEVGFINLAGETICEKALPNSDNPWERLAESAKILKAFAEEHDLSQERILGLGICAPGPLNTINGTILNPPNFASWRNVPVIEILSKHLTWPMQLYNVTDALALEEKHYGAGQNYASIMLLHIDTEGIGSGIIVHNQLFRDICEIGGMLGHMSICYNGKRCSCGNRGCLEMYASIRAILEGSRFGSWQEVMDAAENDSEAKQLVEREALYIATAITNCINMINLERVIITGDLYYKHPYLERRINEIVKKRMILREYGPENRVMFSNTKSCSRTAAIGFLNAYLQEYNAAH